MSTIRQLNTSNKTSYILCSRIKAIGAPPMVREFLRSSAIAQSGKVTLLIFHSQVPLHFRITLISLSERGIRGGSPITNALHKELRKNIDTRENVRDERLEKERSRRTREKRITFAGDCLRWATFRATVATPSLVPRL